MIINKNRKIFTVCLLTFLIFVIYFKTHNKPADCANDFSPRIQVSKRPKRDIQKPNEHVLIPCNMGDFPKAKWGFCDKSKNIIIPAKYDGADPFYEGLASVIISSKKGAVYGFVNQDGTEIVPIKYSNAHRFVDGMTMVSRDGKYGFVNKQGKEIIPLKYSGAKDFYEGNAMVWIGSKWVFSGLGCHSDIYGGKVGFVNKSGKEITPIKYDWVGYFNDGLAMVSLNGKRGFINKHGKEVIPLRYDEISTPYYEGTIGQEEPPCDKDYVDIVNYFEKGVARVSIGKKWGFINKKGEEIVPIEYDDVGGFHEGLARVVLNRKAGYINKQGEIIVPLKYNDYLTGFHNGLAWVVFNKKWGIVDKRGNEILLPKYDYAAYKFSEGRAAVKLGNKWGFVNKEGKEVTSMKYDDTGDFHYGRAAVKRNCRWGFIDKDGKKITRLKYDAVWDFYNGLALVKRGTKEGLVNREGNEIIPVKYDKASIFLNEGLAHIKRGKYWGAMNKNGEEIIPIMYDEIGIFKDGIARVKSDEKIGFINLDGKELTPVKYQTAGHFHEGLCEVSVSHSTRGIIDKNGTEYFQITETKSHAEYLRSLNTDEPVKDKKLEMIRMPMVFIPAGAFIMGSDNNESMAHADEMPKHKVYLDAFYIDKYEVTNAQYKVCVNAGKCDKPYMHWRHDKSIYANHPVVLKWNQASTYCNWAGKRLPTEAEWEKAARGKNERIWPWGNAFDCNKSCNPVFPCSQKTTCAAGSYKEDVSIYGVYDMAGNVEEWVSDWYDENYYKTSPVRNPKGPDNGSLKVLRGGSYEFAYSGDFRNSDRDRQYPDNSSGGFRCAASK